MSSILTKGERIKARVIQTAANLLQRQGYNGTGLSQIIRESATPKGSLYFHFPGGKEELTVAALEASGTEFSEKLRSYITSETDPGDAIEFACATLAAQLTDSDFQKGCPIATVALEASTSSEAIRAVCASHFQGWQELVEAMLTSRGVEQERASELATTAISAIEGAMLLCRANHDTIPLERVGRQLRYFLEIALSAPGANP